MTAATVGDVAIAAFAAGAAGLAGVAAVTDGFVAAVAGGAGVWALAATTLAAISRIRTVCFIALFYSGKVLHGSVSGAPALEHPAINPASSAVLGARCSTRIDSWRASAPSPTAPLPSRVGMPSAAVKLPSEAPPVEASFSGKPSSAARLLAWR